MLGAGGATASTRAARATPDGYTIEMGHMGTHAASVALYPNLAYKPDVDFAPIGLVAGTPVLILANKDFPPRDLREFVTCSPRKTRPSPLSTSSPTRRVQRPDFRGHGRRAGHD